MLFFKILPRSWHLFQFKAKLTAQMFMVSRVIQYVLKKLSIVVSQYPYEDVYTCYDQFAKEILVSYHCKNNDLERAI